MIDFDNFLSWAERTFTDVEISGDEIKVNSIFADDVKRHLWCNPSKNAYHCWKSNASGNLFELVSRVDKCSRQEAAARLCGNDVRGLEERLERFFADKQKPPPPPPPKFALPPDTFLIRDLRPGLRRDAERYLERRKIPFGNLRLCLTGKYAKRIIIPYYGPDGGLIYWNARDITDRSKVKYLGPDAEVGVGKGDVIFTESWPVAGTKMYLAEGEFDAMSLTLSGVHGAACGGKELTDNQVDILRPFRVCICFDTDKSGGQALNKIGDKLLGSGVREVTYVRPPVNYKDWNKMFSSLGGNIVSLYVQSQEKSFTPWTSNTLRFNHIL